MGGALPWTPAGSSPVTNDPSEVLRRIEQNTANLVHWVKILVGVVVVLVIVTALLFV
jgi:hypothetical protein